ncbi:MAG: PilZ domain-containing protein [Myxococcota bacterium]
MLDANRPDIQAVFLDRGELDDVRSLLRDLEIEFCAARNATVGEQVALLISTPDQARALAAGDAEAPPHRLHLSVCRDAADLSVPCDLTLSRPIDPEALRLLARRLDADGADRRLATRVALALPVQIVVGEDRRDVVLARASIGGCGLISPAPVPVGAPLRIEVPEDLTAPRRLALAGCALSCRETTTADGDTFDISVAFEPLELTDRVTLRSLMAGHAVDYRPERGKAKRNGQRVGRERPRGRYRRRVLAACRGDAAVLLARDLSSEGVAIELQDHFTLGDRIRVALTDTSPDPPLLLEAVLERREEDSGFLRFCTLDDSAQARLDALLRAVAGEDSDEARLSL